MKMTMLIVELKQTYLPALDKNVPTGVTGVKTIDGNNNEGVEDNLPSNIR